jgi:curved DNA-binding protein CbpA
LTAPRGVLGVGAADGIEAVRRAYRRLVLECHPDRNSTPAAAARFAAITEAYRALVRETNDGTAQKPKPAAPATTPGEPPILSWKNVESNFHFCLRGLGRLVRKTVSPGSDSKP